MTAFHWGFAAEPAAIQAARRRVGELDLDAEDRRVLALLVSELVTNSVRHASGPSIGVAIELCEDVTRVSVEDGGGGFSPPPAPTPGEPSPSGWGLYLVERFTDRWGVAAEGRTRVWFEMRRPAA